MMFIVCKEGQGLEKKDMKVKKEQLIILLNYLRENNVYYQNCIPDVDFKSIEELDDILQTIPILTKEKIYQNHESYISFLPEEKLIWELTSGTTGTPFKCYKTKRERMLLATVEWKERRNWDKNISPSKFFQLMGVNRKYGINFEDFSDDNIRKAFTFIQNSNATWLCGSPTTLYNYATKIEKKVVQPISSLRYIELQGEYCDTITRNYIEKYFQCRTILHYGNRECWAIAYECKYRNLHVVNSIIVESEKDKQGVETLIVTNLVTKKMPFIRYKTNDIGCIKGVKCKCGKESQIICLAGGRKASLIEGYDIIGDIVFKKIIHNVINDDRISLDIIRRFSIKQKDKKHFVFYLEKGADFQEQIYQEIRNEVYCILGDDIIIDFTDKYFEHSGKFRIFIPLKE